MKTLSARDIEEKLDGKESMATMVEVTIEPGQAGLRRETFYEPGGRLHRVTNPLVAF